MSEPTIGKDSLSTDDATKQIEKKESEQKKIWVEVYSHGGEYMKFKASSPPTKEDGDKLRPFLNCVKCGKKVDGPWIFYFDGETSLVAVCKSPATCFGHVAALHYLYHDGPVGNRCWLCGNKNCSGRCPLMPNNLQKVTDTERAASLLPTFKLAFERLSALAANDYSF